MKAFPSTLIALLCCLGLQAQDLDILRMRIDSIITSHPLMEQASCGIMVYDATTDNIIYKHEEKKLHRPASTAKVFTCATALRFLGADYGIHTSIHTTGKTDRMRVDGEQKKVLEGDLFIKGNFDPTFSSADLDTLLLKAFVQEGIDSIVGNIYTDVTMKNRTLGGAGWCWDDEGDDFPLLSPLIIDKDTCFVSTLLAKLDSLGISFQGEVGDSIVPAEATLLAEKCIALGDLLPACLKESDNRYAEAILYQLGNLNDVNYDPTSESLKYVNQFLVELGFDKSDFRFVDGSGLSFYNAVTPEVEVELLKYIYLKSNFFGILLNALPVSGVDGTLKTRLKGKDTEKRVFAKTGSLTGTYSLAGYLFRADSHMIIFSIMNDGVPHGNGNGIRQMQDQILQVLANPAKAR